MSARAAIHVARSRADVFAFLADGANLYRWFPGVAGSWTFAGAPGKLGSGIHAVTSFLPPSLEPHAAVTYAEPDRALGWALRWGPAAGELHFSLALDPSGTEVTLTARTPAGIATRLAPLFLRGSAARLRAALESSE